MQGFQDYTVSAQKKNNVQKKMGTCVNIFSQESPAKSYLESGSAKKKDDAKDMFKPTTNLFGNESLAFERKANGPMFQQQKKGTHVKNQELIGSNPVRHRVIGGNST